MNFIEHSSVYILLYTAQYDYTLKHEQCHSLLNYKRIILKYLYVLLTKNKVMRCTMYIEKKMHIEHRDRKYNLT